MIVSAMFLTLLVADTLVAQAPPPASEKVPRAEYRIGPEDMLLISVWQNAELSRTVPVRPDGKISLPLVNDVQAEGLTPMELRETLVRRLRDYMPSPEVSVVLAELNSFKVSVVGEVKKPERYRLRSPTTVLDALAMAGGFQDWANRERIVIMRPHSKPSAGGQTGYEWERIPFDYKKVVSAGGEQGNVAVQPGDIIVVP
jgi:polysaccharide export outer membrane protein